MRCVTRTGEYSPACNPDTRRAAPNWWAECDTHNQFMGTFPSRRQALGSLQRHRRYWRRYRMFRGGAGR